MLKLLNRLPHKSILLSNITYWLGGKKPIIREQDEMWRVQGRNNRGGRGAAAPTTYQGGGGVDYALHNITYWLGGKKPIIREQDEMWRVGQGRYH